MAAASAKLGGGLPTPIAYPQRLGRWPAALMILGFAWIELAWSGREEPSSLVIAALIYAVVMLIGMSCFGADTWCRNADGFGVAFGLFALLAPLIWDDRRCWLRAPLVGAVKMEQLAGSVAVVCVMIGSTSFDGFSQGTVWTGALGLAQRLTNLFSSLGFADGVAVEAAYSVGLLLIVGLVAGLYRLAVVAMNRTGSGKPAVGKLARSFAHTLIPIAMAYVVVAGPRLLVHRVWELVGSSSWDGSGVRGRPVGGVRPPPGSRRRRTRPGSGSPGRSASARGCRRSASPW